MSGLRKNIDGSPVVAEMQHGTYSTYQRERREGLIPCELCRQARNVYMREWRGKNPVKRRTELDQRAVRARALSKLARTYERELNRLIQQEMAAGK